MKIAKVDAIPVRAELGNMAEFWAEDMWGRDERGASWLRPENEWRKRPIYSKYIETMLVRVLTDDGLIGYGECHMPITPQIGKAIIDDLLAPIIIDQNPMATEYIWEQLYASMRLRGYDSGFFMEAIAGIDIALWDIKGKALGVPIYTLLGGPITTSLRAYHSHLPAASPKYLAELAQRIISQGYTAIELGGGTGVAGDVRAVAAVREVVGPDVQIMMDCGGAYNLSSALSLAKELEKLNLWFLEDPLPHEDYDGYAELGKRLNFAIATGESKCTRYHFRDLLKSGGVDIVLPDIGRSGGITETLKIAHLADAFHKLYSPHISVGSSVYQAASLHLSAAVSNLAIVESWSGTNPLNSIFLPAMAAKSGYVEVPSGPGLGLEIDEQLLKKYSLL